MKSKDLIDIDVSSEMKSSYLDYAMSVIVSRAIPDVRDGLKPVHRRILYAMYDAGYNAYSAHRKSSRIVGDTMGKYHPHGEAAIYDSLVRMAQDFSLRVPLINGQGNFGSIDGDSAAATRYTEARLAKSAHALVDEIDKDTVDFVPNYDNSESEPVALPATFPNLLINGSGGIAVGMATNIPPHNLSEVIDACCLYADNNDVEIDELCKLIKGPDFPTGGKILGVQGIQSAYLTGRGSITIRGMTEIEELSNREAIIITEIPYMVNKAKLVEKIADLAREKKIEGIADLRDESNKKGIRIVIELKKDAISDMILNQLYAYTQLQSNFGVIMLAIDDGIPKIMNLKQIIAAFIKFREIVITRRTIFLLDKSRAKSHVLIGLIVAVKNIDTIISIIRSAQDSAEAKSKLMSCNWDVSDMLSLIKLVGDGTVVDESGNCKFTPTQAKAILDMRLHRLTALEQSNLQKDIEALAKEIKYYLEILNSRSRLLEILKEELIQIKKDFGTPRLTSIEIGEFDQDLESLIPKEDMVATVTLNGYIKRVPLKTYKSQNRGGKGRAAATLKEEDFVTKIFVGSTHTSMLFFSSRGIVYNLKLYSIPLATPQGRGKPIVNLLPLNDGEYITTIMPLPDDEDDIHNMYIMFATANGNIRRNNLSDFKYIQSNGKIAIKLGDDDKLVNVKLCRKDDHVLLATKLGKAIRCLVESVRVFKSRTSDGVRGMKLTSKDEVISMTVLRGGLKYSAEERKEFLKIPLSTRQRIASFNSSDESKKTSSKACDISKYDIALNYEQVYNMAIEEEFILTVTENGFGKKTSAYEYRITSRGGSGIANMDLSKKTGDVLSVMPAMPDDELMLITDNAQVIRCKLNAIRTTGRNTGGVILFKTAKDEHVVSVSLISDAESQDDYEYDDSDQ
ncbi:MAG: DNA topoisomerase (ATP-hydrolyzing) subunit A [Rickettsiaceae bacterium]